MTYLSLILALFIDDTVMARISSASFINDSSEFTFTIPPSIHNSIQYIDSSASSSTIPIFAMKSAVNFALQAAR